MRKAILAVMTFLMLAAMSASVFAFEYGNPNIPDDTKFETFGPRCDNLLIKLYASETSEWDTGVASYEIDVTDWPLDAAHYATFNANPALKVISYGAEFGLYLLELNNNNNAFLGNPEDPAYPNPVYPNPMSNLALRKAAAYLADRDYICNTVIGNGFGIPVYTPMSPASGFYVDPDIKPGGAGESLCYLYSVAQANAVLDDSGEFPIVGGWRTWNGGPLTLKLFARSDLAGLLAAGTKLYHDLEDLVKIHVWFTPGDLAAARVQVMGNKDFHIYTGFMSLGVDPTHLSNWHWDYYWHPGQCYNTAGCNNPDFNEAVEGIRYANTEEEAACYAYFAQGIFAQNVLSVPLYSMGGNKVVSRTHVGPETEYSGKYWEGFVNIPGYGVDNYFTFLNMHPEEAGMGGTIRYGLSTNIINSLNPLYASDTAGNKVLDMIGYEPLLYIEPYTRELRPWLCDRFVVGTWDNGGTTCTAINFTMRRNSYWSDGTNVTFADIEYTFVTLKNDLAARGLPDPWWMSNVQNIVQFVQYSPTQFEVRLDVKSVFAVGWVGLNRILPKHIWQPICTGAIAPKSGLPWDPTTFAPDPNLIHSGPWCLDSYVASSYILLKAHRPGVYNTGITDPNGDSEDITSPYGYLIKAGRVYEPHFAVQAITDSKTGCLPMPAIGEGYVLKVNVTVNNIGALNDTCKVALFSGTPSIPLGSMIEAFGRKGDISRDGFIDEADLELWYRASGSRPGDPNWNPDADLTGDGVVNIHDAIFLGPNYGSNIWAAYELGTVIAAQRISTVLSGNPEVVTVSWNTTGFAKGSYLITACANLVEVGTDGYILITIPGDINGDQKVNVLDAILTANSFNSKLGNTNWNPNADINCDDKVNILDCIVLANYFGQS